MPTPNPAQRCSTELTAVEAQGFDDLNSAPIVLTAVSGRGAGAPQLTVVSNDTAGTLTFSAVQEGGSAFVAQIRANSDKRIQVPLIQIDSGNGALTAECYWLSSVLSRNP
jgi:hypothetical protein